MNAASQAYLDTRFATGQRVRVSNRPSLGHCRTPVYLRGLEGTVIAIAGRFHNPEQLAYHRPGLPKQVLYRVRFAQRDVWRDTDCSERDDLEADIFEHWLEPVMEDAQ